MADDPIGKAYPRERRNLTFCGGHFSGDGTLFAVVLKDITIGDPEQVWLYEIRSQRLIPITEMAQASMSIRIRDLVWDDDGTLYISAERIHVVARPFFIAATMTQVNEIDSPPAQIANAFKRRARGEYRNDLREEQSDRYVVTLTNQGHGDLSLRMRPANGGVRYEIMRGGWELESFLFDEARSEVLYPSGEAIITFDLQTRQSRYFLRGTGGDLRLLDRTRDGAVVAYTVAGPCAGKPDYDTTVRQARRVCFVKQ
jgi:hypothetical protein